MPNEENIQSDVETPRLTDKQENVLFNLAMRQDDYGWEPTNMLLHDLESNTMLMDMAEKGFIDYSVINPGGTREIASLCATMKGIRHCALLVHENAYRQS
ncbi:hypothetical protein [Raoultibacter phocaeensis]|uniref:hypothetical protein n=1 Tax=Raoultibacter phocaeensis TaxID=2479841 RepID=UPI0011199765|nr:hypothetical protein [Raoultibacter phocaeensis]